VDAGLAAEMRAAVVGWYRAAGRPLAFRRTSDPWAVLVSEVMAQQTQAARAAKAWERFLVTYPTPAALATASPADVLRAWRGLGYNRRALALRAAAIEILERHGGRLPSEVAALEALPGVGPYTARAVAALAFGVRVGAVDTNVRRVLGRTLFDGQAIAAELQGAADALVPEDRPGEWTHAVMDIGATFCRSRNPRCAACPLRPWCRYAARQAAAPPATGPPRRPREAPFQASTRWLRGRILDRLRDAPPREWVSFPEPIGPHTAAAVDGALRALADDALVELRGGAPAEARLPIA